MTRGIRKGLTKEIILAAAFDIVEKGGVESLSMRHLGGSLDVAAMAIYNHFPDRERLLDAMAEAVWSAIPLNEQKKDWKKRVKTIVGSIAALAAEKPAVFTLCMSRPTKPKAAIALMSSVLDSLRLGGLSDKEAVICYHSVLILLHGFPFWQSGLTKYCLEVPSTPDLSKQELKDWKLLHGVDARMQLEASVSIILDAFDNAAKV